VRNMGKEELVTGLKITLCGGLNREKSKRYYNIIGKMDDKGIGFKEEEGRVEVCYTKIQTISPLKRTERKEGSVITKGGARGKAEKGEGDGG